MRKKILIVDDDPTIQELLQLILEREGYQIWIATNADWLEQPDFPMPDLFLLDRFLANADGLKVCERLKANEATRQIPVVMISASDDIAQKAIAAGADDFVEKPFNIIEITNVVRANLIKK